MITLLPDHVANQIAAGEVVQRPAAAVKELMENAIDAKATDIKLIIKDSGKTLIQVIDNGSGMNEVDARMCFERHATSKITKAEDLFALSTKGFRGEALASIAAIAQVELKTKCEDAEFVCKPEFAKKSRGAQFFFVNNRFIKSSYLNHAVSNSMEGLLQGDVHPSYFLFLEVDPAKIDVNIHPTKTEIKFEDERSIYAILRAALKRSLGQYNIAPSIDFSLNPDLQVPITSKNRVLKTPSIQVDPSFNPFDSENQKEPFSTATKSNNNENSGYRKPLHAEKGKHWEALFEEIQDDMKSAIPEYENSVVR